MLTTIRYTMMLIAVLAWGTIATGCREQKASMQAKSHEHEHEHEHEEHMHHPPHYPKNLSDAIDRICVLAGIAEGPATAQKKVKVTACEEMVDLVSWLPELAADSDVTEATFNQVDQLWMTLEKKVQESKLDLRSSSAPGWLIDWVKSQKDSLEQAKAAYRASLPVDEEEETGK